MGHFYSVLILWIIFSYSKKFFFENNFCVLSSLHYLETQKLVE